MGRRSRAETVELQEQIIDEALRQFADRGVQATPVADIAKAVGISKQALMHHFRTKSALTDAIEERLKRVMDAALPGLVAAFLADDTELDAVLSDILALMDENIELTRYLLRRVAFSPPVDVPKSGTAIGALMIDYLRRGQEDGTLRGDFVPEDRLFNLGMLFIVSQAAAFHPNPHRGDLTQEQVRLNRGRDLMQIVRAALLPDGGHKGA